MALTDSSTQYLVRQQYRLHLSKAQQGRLSPEKWFSEWQIIYEKAQAFNVTEVTGELAITDFLDAVSVKIAPEWSRNMRQQIAMDMALGRPALSFDQLSRVFAQILQEQAILGPKGNNPAIMATTGGSAGKKATEKKPTASLKDCPCKSKEKRVHYWDPESCDRLCTALTGHSAHEGKEPVKLVAIDVKIINKRLNSLK
jgi:hypothetical protein